MADSSFNHLINIIFNTLGATKATTDIKSVGDSLLAWDVKSHENTINNLGTAIQGVGDNTKKLETPLKQGKSAVDELGLAMRRALLVAPVWLALRNAMMGVLELFKTSIRSLIDWEYQMAQIRVITGGSAEQFSTLSQKLLQLSAAFGISAATMGEAARIWAQQGITLSELPAIMESTIKLSFLTGQTLSKSAEDLTALMKAYNLTISQTSQITDKLHSVEDKHAVSIENLISGLRKVAPLASEMGISMEKLTGIITATQVATRASGDAVGNAWKTIFTRMSTSAKDVIENIAKVPVYLTATGQATFQATSSLRNQGDVLDEIAARWNTYSTTQKAAISQAVAGVRQVTFFRAAMKDWKESIDATIDSLNSFGATDKATSILLDTTKGKIDQLSASWIQLVNTIANSEGLKKSVDTLKLGVQFLDRLAQIAGSPNFGKFEASQRDQAEAAKALAVANQEEENRIRATITTTQQLNSLLATRARLLLDNSKGSQEALNTINGYITKVQSALTNQPEFNFAKTFNLDALGNAIKEQTPGLQNELLDIISQGKLQSKIATVGEAVNTQFNQIKKEWQNNFIRGTFSFPDIDTASLNSIINLRDKINERLMSGTMFNQKEIDSYSRIVAGLNIIVDNLRKKNALAEAGTAPIKEELLQKQEVASIDNVSQQNIKNQLALIKDKKELGFSDLEIAKEQLNLLNKNTLALDDSNTKERTKLANDIIKLTLQKDYNKLLNDESLYEEELKNAGFSDLQIQLQRLAVLKQMGAGDEAIKNQQEAINRASIANTQMLIQHELELARIRGASPRQLFDLNRELQQQVLYGTNVDDGLKNQLELEKLITQEKVNQNKASSDQISLLKVFQKYGLNVAEEVAKYISGQISVEEISKRTQSALKQFFPGQLEQGNTAEFFRTGAGQDILNALQGGALNGVGNIENLRNQALQNQVQVPPSIQNNVPVEISVNLSTDLKNLNVDILASIKDALNRQDVQQQIQDMIVEPY